MIQITTNKNKTFTASDGRLKFTNKDHLLALGQLALKSEETQGAREAIVYADKGGIRYWYCMGSEYGATSAAKPDNNKDTRQVGAIVALAQFELGIDIETDFE